MAVQVYPFGPIVDDPGALVAGATVTIVSVKTAAGVDIAAHGATVIGVDGSNVLAGADLFVSYDAELKGDANVILAVSKAGRTLSNLLATPRRYLTRDSQLLGQLTFTVPIDGGTVSASPAPTTTTFAAAGSGLHAPTGGYSPTLNPMRVMFTSGPNAGLIRPLVATTGHVRAGTVHTLVVSVAFPAAPASSDTFVLI